MPSYNTDKAVNKVLYNKHRRRKNNDIVAAMYAMYCVPHSLEYIGKIYNRSRQTIYDLFKSRGYKLRSKQMKGLQVLDGINFTLTNDGYLRGNINKKRVLMHHYIWEKANGDIPADHCIYHVDKNKINNDLDNLRMIHKSQMSSIFNPKGINQYTKNLEKLSTQKKRKK